MKKINLLSILMILLLPIVFGNVCDVDINQNNITISDSIEPDGKGSDCRVSLSVDSKFLSIKNMTRQESFYNASFNELGHKGQYNAFIECNLGDDVSYSECDFVLDDNRLKSLTCPKDNLGEVIMYIFIFMAMVVAYVYAKTTIKFPFVEVIISVGFLIFSISLLGCNQVIGMIGIMMSVAMGIIAFMD